MELVQQLVESIAVRAYRMGFQRIVIISIHGPNNSILYLSVRSIFEKYHIPVLFINAYKPFDDATAELFGGADSGDKEASLVLAALRIIGQPELYSEEEMAYVDTVPAYPDKQMKLHRMGGIGYFMQDPRQHACPSGQVSLEKGLKFFDKQVHHIVSAIEDLRVYAQEVKKQNNKGWSGVSKL